MKEVIRYQSDSGNLYDTKAEAIRDDEQSVIEQDTFKVVFGVWSVAGTGDY